MDIEAYKAYLSEMGKSENTISAYCKDIEIFMRFMAEKSITDPAEVSKTEVISYVLRLKDSGTSGSTINRKLSSLRTFYGFLRERGEISENPCQGIKSPKVERRSLEHLTIEEVDRLLAVPENTIKGIRDKAILELMYATGIRVSELTETKLTDLNMRMGFVMCSGHHGKARIVPFGRPAKAALEAYLETSRPALIGDKETDTLFVNYAGDVLTRQGLWKILKENAAKAGLSIDITPQTLRNSFAVHMLQNGADLKSLQELMGHEDISATEAYLTVTKRRIKDVYDKTHPRA